MRTHLALVACVFLGSVPAAAKSNTDACIQARGAVLVTIDTIAQSPIGSPTLQDAVSLFEGVSDFVRDMLLRRTAKDEFTELKDEVLKAVDEDAKSAAVARIKEEFTDACDKY